MLNPVGPSCVVLCGPRGGRATILLVSSSPLINPRKWESDDDMPIQHGVPKALDIGFNSLVPNSEVRKIYKVVLEGLYVVAWRGCDISRQNRQASHPEI